MKKLMIATGVGVSIFVIAGIALAQTYTPLAPLPIGEGGATPTTYTLTSYLSGAIKLLIAVAGALAVLMTIIGGAQYVAAGINPSAKSDARGRIENALIGLVLVLTSYLLLRSIDPRLVEFNLALPPVGQLPVAAPSTTTSSPQAPTQTSSFLRGGGATSRTRPSGGTATTPIAPVGTPSQPTSGTTAQSVLSARINRNNDLSIISNCVGNTTYDLCPRTDLNGDGQTTTADVLLFIGRGRSLDINQNNTVELADLPAAASCYFKISNANVQSMLPVEIPSDGAPIASCGGSGRTLPPNTSCNGGTWIKESMLAPRCAVESGLSTMPFGYVYGGGSGYSQFASWAQGAAQGDAISLGDLFVKTFFRQVLSGDSMQIEYAESDLGKLAYTTIAAYDLNNDGTADFSASGADMAVWSGCRGQAISGACAQADFNGDGVVDDRDLGFVNFMRSNVLGSSSMIPLGWQLSWFESMFFDPTGYTDKQILKHCIGRTAFEKCAAADVNGDRTVNNTDLTTFEQTGASLDFNGDGKVDLR